MRGVVDKTTKAMARAEEIQANLSLEHPSFIKAMRKSHVSNTFYTSTPTEFCKKYLPMNDEIVVFEVESGKSYNVKLLGSKYAFSGGWKAFAEAEKLLENDVLVFHLIEPCKFKVYIVRASELAQVDKAPKVNKTDDLATEREVGQKGKSERDTKRPKLVSQEFIRDLVEVNVSSKKSYIRPININPSKEGFRSSEFVSDFKNFKIKVDGMTIELSKEVQEEYFKLCCNQKTYLHRHLIKGIDPGLAASVISGTVDISNAIRESKISTPRDKIAYWNKALDGFEVFGMNIGFIRARLIRLSGLTFDLKRYKEAKSERKCVEEKIIELKKAKRRLDEKIEGMGKAKAMHEEEASFPW